MRYLVTTKDAEKPFLTNWFEPENNFNSEVGMIVYDLWKNEFTTDGTTWKAIELDHL